MKKFLEKKLSKLIELTSITSHHEVNKEGNIIVCYAGKEGVTRIDVKAEDEKVLCINIETTDTSVIIRDNTTSYNISLEGEVYTESDWVDDLVDEEDWQDLVKEVLKILIKKLNNVQELTDDKAAKRAKRKEKLNKIKNSLKKE